MPCIYLFPLSHPIATGLCFWRYVEMKKLAADPPPFYFTMDITVYFRYTTTWLVLGKQIAWSW